MTKPHSIRPRRNSKPKSDFPLFLHRSGQWAKKVRQKLHYFGSDRDKALDRWLEEKDYLLAGKKPRTGNGDCLTVGRLCNLFLESRERKVSTGELTQITYDDYLKIAELLVKELGRNTSVELLDPRDFADLRAELAKGCNLKTLEGKIAYVRAIFNYADKNGFLDTPLSKIWGTEFSKPSVAALSKLRNETTRFFEAEEVEKLLDGSSPQLNAMIHLGINCGFGNTDVAKLQFSQVDLKTGWIEQPRSKTGRKRRCPLWPETIFAIQNYLKVRSIPKDGSDKDYIFITKYGSNWIPKDKANPLSAEFGKLRKSLGFAIKGKTFYSLRHTFQTVGDETRDFVAVSSIMGHSGTSISDHYRERISDERLQAVTDHVRGWLLGSSKKRKGGGE